MPCTYSNQQSFYEYKRQSNFLEPQVHNPKGVLSWIDYAESDEHIIFFTWYNLEDSSLWQLPLGISQKETFTISIYLAVFSKNFLPFSNQRNERMFKDSFPGSNLQWKNRFLIYRISYTVYDKPCPYLVEIQFPFVPLSVKINDSPTGRLSYPNQQCHNLIHLKCYNNSQIKFNNWTDRFVYLIFVDIKLF